jgi:ubiquinone/menaquinone biosynthesis C-methylase UbiE
VASHYPNLIGKKDMPNLINVVKNIIEPRVGEKVLDVGNGGTRHFSPPQTSFYVGVDFSLEMLKRGEDKTFNKVCGEATNLSFKKETFNTILYHSLLHHLARGSIGSTIEAVKHTLREGYTCLKKEGNVIITEPCLPSFLEKVERAFFFIFRAFLILTKQSEVLLFSAETLTRILTECGFREVRAWKIDRKEESPWKWVSISIALPGIKIPRWVNPSKSTIFEARN